MLKPFTPEMAWDMTVTTNDFRFGRRVHAEGSVSKYDQTRPYHRHCMRAQWLARMDDNRRQAELVEADCTSNAHRLGLL